MVINQILLKLMLILEVYIYFNDPFWDNEFEEWTSLKAWNGRETETDQSIDF